MDVMPELASEIQAIRKAGSAYVETIHFSAGITLTGYGAVAAPILGLDGLPEFVVVLFLRMPCTWPAGAPLRFIWSRSRAALRLAPRPL